MKTFIITLSSNEESVKSTERTIQSAKNVGYNEPIEKFEAILPSEWHTILLGGRSNPHNSYFQRYNIYSLHGINFFRPKKTFLHTTSRQNNDIGRPISRQWRHLHA